MVIYDQSTGAVISGRFRIRKIAETKQKHKNKTLSNFNFCIQKENSQIEKKKPSKFSPFTNKRQDFLIWPLILFKHSITISSIVNNSNFFKNKITDLSLDLSLDLSVSLSLSPEYIYVIPNACLLLVV